MNWAWQLHLKPTIKFVLMALADAADDEGHCWPSVPTLAHKTCMDERSVQRILKVLKDSCFIEVQARYRNDGSPTSNKYRLALITTGDNLSPPQRQYKHQVVVSASPRGGAGVTQTTTESEFNQKPPLQNNEAAKTASSYANFIYPSQLKLEERELAKSQLNGIDSVLAQAVLDELAARLNANKVTGAPLSYLRSLITRAKAGQFTPEAGVRISLARAQERLAELKKLEETVKPTDPKEIPKYLAAMHQAIARKQPSTEQE